jgi:hypothetical protein
MTHRKGKGVTRAREGRGIGRQGLAGSYDKKQAMPLQEVIYEAF